VRFLVVSLNPGCDAYFDLCAVWTLRGDWGRHGLEGGRTANRGFVQFAAHPLKTGPPVSSVGEETKAMFYLVGDKRTETILPHIPRGGGRGVFRVRHAPVPNPWPFQPGVRIHGERLTPKPSWPHRTAEIGTARGS